MDLGHMRVQEEDSLRATTRWARKAAAWPSLVLDSAAVGILPAATALLRGERPSQEETTSSAEPIVHYEILVQGVLDAHWSAWFDGLRVSGDADVGTTTIAGEVTDQAALHGLLAKVRDLGLPLLAVRRIQPD
jgi:hypothetical protein